MFRFMLLGIFVCGCSGPDEFCPEGTERFGEGPPRGVETKCKREDGTGKMVLHGPKVQWFIGGKKQTETHFVDGLETGSRRVWNKQGELVSETPFVKGKEHGAAIDWYAPNKKRREVRYQVGKRDGTATEWYPNGRKKSERRYDKDTPVGAERRWHDNGLPVGETVWVNFAAGTFKMGAKDERTSKPRTVKVGAFQLSKSEVTVEQYAACVKAGGCTAPKQGRVCNWGMSGRGLHPVNCVTWHQADAYAKWAKARLATEAEWEYAARGAGTQRLYPWGAEPATCEYAVMGESEDGCGRNRTWPVCSKPKGHSPQGLCDMAGGVSEWTGTKDKRSYVFRGGNWNSTARQVRTVTRRIAKPKRQAAIIGFRVARDISDRAR